MRQNRPKRPAKAPVAKATKCETLAGVQPLRDDKRIFLSNNAAERAIRPIKAAGLRWLSGRH